MPSAVAVLVVNYRVYDELDRALATLVPALGPGDEIAVFDQESHREKLATVEARYPAIRTIPCNENLGFAAGVNRAAAATRAPYLLLLNPDTLVTSSVVSLLAEWLDGHERTGLVGPRVLNDDGSVQASARRFPGLSTGIAGRSTWLTRRFPNNWLTRANLPAREATSATTVDWLAGSCVMTRRDLFERLGGLDEAFFMYWEDADFARRARDFGYTCTYLPTVTVRHVGGRSAATNPGPSIRAFHRSAYRMYWKHGGAASRLAAPLVKLCLWARGEWHARRVAARLARQNS